VTYAKTFSLGDSFMMAVVELNMVKAVPELNMVLNSCSDKP